jgi:hypothetical protein
MTFVQQALDRWIRLFAKEFVDNRQRDILNRGLINTENLRNSMYAKVHSDTQRDIYFTTIHFPTYGRFQDMNRRYVKAGGPEMVTNIEAWAAKEGAAKFRKGEYAEKYKGYTDQEVNRAVAWGIIKKLPTLDRTRKRSWWNKGKTKDIEVYYDLLLRMYTEGASADAVQTLEKN